jgi:hypothetical protein
MKKITILFGLLLFAYSVSAQKYRTALGPRFGRSDFGVSLQQKIKDRTTLEGIFSAGNREVTGTVLIEQHFPLMGKGFNYYLGAGAHVGNLKDSGGFYGGDLILGSEMKLPLLPLVLSLDVKPAFHANHTDWLTFGGGFTLRYILVKEKVERKRFGIFGGGNNDDDRRRNRRNKNKKEEPRRGGLFDWLKE